jgi:IS605 OrfB family transposase
VKLTVVIKLQPTPQQANALLATLERANDAANAMSVRAWETRTFARYALHRLVYHPVRAAYGLPAQLVVLGIAKVADAYKQDRKRLRRFRPHGSIAYDDRVLAWHPAHVSLSTLAGRLAIPFVGSVRQRQLLELRRGESDLIYRDGAWYLATTVEVPEALPVAAGDVLGVDLGIVNIAYDSDGHPYSGRHVNKLRRRHRRLRRKLSRKFTGSARRLYRKRRRKERRFATHVNHTISKRIVAEAEGTGRAIALEELSGIRDRVTVRRSQRATFSSWSFAQLRGFIEYKAQRAGVRVILVDPRNSSRTCPACGHIDKANRPSQASFSCVSCGFAGHADHIAALILRDRGRAAL